jgi:predicted DNA-binding protein with PD1-like motif
MMTEDEAKMNHLNSPGPSHQGRPAEWEQSPTIMTSNAGQHGALKGRAKLTKFQRNAGTTILSVTAVVLLILSIVQAGYRQNADLKTIRQYTKVPSGYLMVLQQGDNVFEALENFAVHENIPSANFSAIGFADVTFGFFDPISKNYKSRDFKRVELTSMVGTIAWKDGKPSIHSHATAGDENFQSFGGHVLNAAVTMGSLEIMLVIHDKRLERRNDELGGDVLEIRRD